IEDHLQALSLWIRGGSPEDTVVDGTAALLGACLGEPDPLKIPVPDAPPLGQGVQFRQTAWDLPAQFENEICMATYYDLTQTNLVPDEAKIPCPERYQQSKGCFVGDDPIAFGLCEDDSDCKGAQTCQIGKNLISDGECFVWNKSTLFQDPQSHHSILHAYSGRFPVEHPGWTKLTDEQGQEIGQQGWTLKFSDPTNPLQGAPCDPTDIDPNLGYHPNCSGSVQETIACLGFGPPDYSNLLSLIGDEGNAPQLLVSTEPKLEIALPDEVYDILPMRGILVWNSHAFNLTTGDSTMDQYLQLEYAEAAEAQHQSIELFDAGSIFTQKIPPFETREYCRTWTAPLGTHLFRLSSHTHRFGILFRIWAPPNGPCVPVCDADKPVPQSLCFAGLPTCSGPRADPPMYASTEYTDPLQMYFDPPVVHEEEDPADRSYLYCAVYDNGSTPTSPPLKRQATSPPPPLGSIGELIGGGPCDDEETQCTNGPDRGSLCAGDDSLCDSAPGAGDGICDACPVRGGVTTEDEMLILFGNFFCPGGESCEQDPF
ncbi:MAG: hypothetical protein O7A09_07755, partial [Proteobacteria bacterium]|nr:hypothetical protein [Pseudomonadota bacterium]